MIPESFIQELLSRADLLEIVRKAVPTLKKTGKNFMGCCPFHKEKTPSFSVSPQKGFFKCFGCGAAGNAIGFVMKYESLSYPEAIRRVAEMYGMSVPEDRVATERHAKAKTLTDRMKMAADFYTEALAGNERAKAYLTEREITADTAARFALGYSPDAWQALEGIFGAHYNDPEMTENGGCGLVIVNENGRRYDRFRGRLMYPIRNPRGQVIGFGARTLNGDEHPKYLNSPETAIYKKGEEIYGLYEAQDAIRRKDRAIVCEGYMDVIQLSQAGFTEAVAALGTAITSDHVRKLLKMVDKIYFSFDGDSAGQHALRRAMEAALPVVQDTHEVRFVVLPPEHDPDSLIKEEGPAGFEAQLAGSLTLTQYFMKTVGEGKDLGTAEGRSQFLAEAKPLIAGMRASKLLRRMLLEEIAMPARTTADELARLFGIVEPALSASMPAARPGWKPYPQTPGKKGYGRGYAREYGRGNPPRSEGRPPQGSMSERILQYLLCYPELAREFSGAIEEEVFPRSEAGDGVCARIVEVWRAVTGSDEPVTKSDGLLARLADSPNARVFAELLAREMVLQTPLEVARIELSMAMGRLELESVQEKERLLMNATPVDTAQYLRLFEQEKRVRAFLEETKKAQTLLAVRSGTGEA